MSENRNNDRGIRLAGLVLAVVGVLFVLWTASNAMNTIARPARSSKALSPSIAVVAFAAVALVTFGLASLGRRRTRDSAGTAAWATTRDVKDMLRRRGDVPKGGLVIGEFKGRDLTLDRERTLTHTLVVGPTGCGKTRSFIMPNLARPRTDSWLASDPKGELAGCTASVHRRVRIYSPLNPKKSECLNWVPRCADPVIALLLGRALAMQRRTGDKGDFFWVEAESLILAALFAHVAATATPTPAAVYELATSVDPDKLVAVLSASPSETARGLVAGLRLAGDSKVRSGVLIGVLNALAFLTDPKIREFTASTTRGADFTEFRAWPCGAYWIVPQGDVARLSGLSAIFFNLFLHDIKNAPAKTEVTLFLDEVGNLGKIPDFAKEITLLRGLGVAFVLAIQALSQLESLYGREDARTIWNNCLTWIVHAGLRAETAEEVSRALGEHTVLGANEGWSRSRSGGLFGKPSLSRSGGASERARRLATGDEVRRFSKQEAAVIHDNLPPIRVQKRMSTLTSIAM